MTTTAVKIGLIALLAGASLSFGRSQDRLDRPTLDLDTFPDSRILRDLEDELEDIFYDPRYGHQDLGSDYANEEVPVDSLHAEIILALGDEGDDEGYEEWDEKADAWWDEGEFEPEEWEGEEGWNGEEISLADLEAEMAEAGTTLDAVVWAILEGAADDEVAAWSGAPRIVLAGFGFGVQGARDRNRRVTVGPALRGVRGGIREVIRRRP